jgi:hypothetical protein
MGNTEQWLCIYITGKQNSILLFLLWIYKQVLLLSGKLRNQRLTMSIQKFYGDYYELVD